MPFYYSNTTLVSINHYLGTQLYSGETNSNTTLVSINRNIIQDQLKETAFKYNSCFY